MAEEMLTQEEVWDDSALVKSWNEAYQEYLKYHSIAAQGQKVEAASLRTEQLGTNGYTSKPEQSKTGSPVENTAESALHHSTAAPVMPNIPQAPSSAANNSIPQALTASVQDDEMKNLMMSWYYAGYYTGLYEGKQQGYASAKHILKDG